MHIYIYIYHCFSKQELRDINFEIGLTKIYETSSVDANLSLQQEFHSTLYVIEFIIFCNVIKPRVVYSIPVSITLKNLVFLRVE